LGGTGLRGTGFGAAAAGGPGLAGTACARTGDPAIPASAASMINDLARLVIGAINPFISKDNPPFQNPYTGVCRLASDRPATVARLFDPIVANQSLSGHGYALPNPQGKAIVQWRPVSFSTAESFREA
jgi:hypothetical protein